MGESLATRETVEALRAEFRAELAGLRQEIAALREDAEAGRAVLDMPSCARLLNVSEKTVRRRMADGRLPFVRIGGDRTVRFVRADVVAALRKGLPRRGTPRLHSRRHAPSKGAVRPETRLQKKVEESARTT